MEEVTGVEGKGYPGKRRLRARYTLLRREEAPTLGDLALRRDLGLEKDYPNIKWSGNALLTEVFIPTFGKGGAYLWARAAPLFDPAGNVTGAIEAVRDITENRITEQKLERSKAEISIAAEIQRRFIPDNAPIVSDFRLAAVTIPAMEGGGDF
jgi:hypothetical protein